jgi:hypothetical protein
MREKPGFKKWWENLGRIYSYQVTPRELCAAAFAAGLREGRKPNP